MDFALLLRRLRLAAGLTQSDLADRSGIARPNIAAYEAGRREPKWSTAERLLAAVDGPLVRERECRSPELGADAFGAGVDAVTAGGHQVTVGSFVDICPRTPG